MIDNMNANNINIENEFGYFSVELSATEDYFRLLFKDVLLICDSACEDLYDEETAEACFNDYINEYCDEQSQMTLAAAIDEGYEYNHNLDFDDNAVDAENFLIHNEDVEKTFVHCNLTPNGYSYKNHVVSGDIFDFGHFRAENKVYFQEEEDGSFTPVDWFEVPAPGEEGRENYIFVFDTIVYDGEVLMLYDRFD